MPNKGIDPNWPKWRQQFEKLHTNLGVRRPDLYHYLTPDLRNLWGITPAMERNAAEVRDKVIAALEEMLPRVDFGRGDTAKGCAAVRASYGITDIPKMANASEKTRLEWLSEFDRGTDTVPYGSSRNYVRTARAKFFEILADQLKDEGVIPGLAVKPEPSPTAETEVEQVIDAPTEEEEPVDDSAPPLSKSRRFWSRPQRLFLVVGPVTIVLSAASVWALAAQRGPENRPVTLDFTGQEPHGFTYAFAKKLDFSSSQLGSLAQAHNEVAAGMSLPSMGGVPLATTDVAISLLSRSGQTVTITGLEVKPTCQRPLAGTLVYAPDDPGVTYGDSIGFDLDTNIRYGRADHNGQLGENYFLLNQATLQPGQTLSLDATVTTKTQYCQFTFNLIVDTPGKVFTVPVDNAGHPFTITAVPPKKTAAPYSGFQQMYIGGYANPANNGIFVEADPRSYPGAS